jgi:hypothetical protein
MCEWDLPLNFYRAYQLCIAHLVIKIIHLQQGDIWKGTTMQHITPSSPKDPTHSAQYIACIEK